MDTPDEPFFDCSCSTLNIFYNDIEISSCIYTYITFYPGGFCSSITGVRALNEFWNISNVIKWRHEKLRCHSFGAIGDKLYTYIHIFKAELYCNPVISGPSCERDRVELLYSHQSCLYKYKTTGRFIELKLLPNDLFWGCEHTHTLTVGNNVLRWGVNVRAGRSQSVRSDYIKVDGALLTVSRCIKCIYIYLCIYV